TRVGDTRASGRARDSSRPDSNLLEWSGDIHGIGRYGVNAHAATWDRGHSGRPLCGSRGAGTRDACTCEGGDRTERFESSVGKVILGDSKVGESRLGECGGVNPEGFDRGGERESRAATAD